MRNGRKKAQKAQKRGASNVTLFLSLVRFFAAKMPFSFAEEA
jgi:hypothetical protein